MVEKGIEQGGMRMAYAWICKDCGEKVCAENHTVWRIWMRKPKVRRTYRCKHCQKIIGEWVRDE